MIDRDFGLVGTVEPNPKGQEVKLTIKGSGLGVPLDRWLKKDEVFAIARIQRGGRGLQATREEAAVLQVIDDRATVSAAARSFSATRNRWRAGRECWVIAA